MDCASDFCYLPLLVLFYLMTFSDAVPIQGCQPAEFRCNNGYCIPSSWRCDRYTDCSDGSDEEGCSVLACDAGEYKCLVNGKCIPEIWLCDDIPDCSMGEDEQNCTRRTPSASIYVSPRTENLICINSSTSKSYHISGFLPSYSTFITPDIQGSRIFTSGTSYLQNTSTIYQSAILPGVNNTQPAALDIPNMADVDGIAYDWVYDNLYWTDGRTKEIRMISLKNEEIYKTLFKNDRDSDGEWLFFVGDTDSKVKSRKIAIHKPRPIVVHPEKGTIYWADWGDDPYIAFGAQDGSVREVLVYKRIPAKKSDFIMWPNALVIDFNSGDVMDKIYWLDAGLRSILRCPLASCSDKTASLVYKSEETIRGSFSMGLFRDSIYWTSYLYGKGSTVMQFKDGEAQPLYTSKPNSGSVVALSVWHEEIQPELPNVCIDSQGRNPCLHICVPSFITVMNSSQPSAPFTCLCGESYDLALDNVTCQVLPTVMPTTQTSNTTHESGCDAQSKFSCGDGQCIWMEWRCDNDSDCTNGADEKDCHLQCDENEFDCGVNSYGGNQCIRSSWVCDWELDCEDGSDEVSCFSSDNSTHRPVAPATTIAVISTTAPATTTTTTITTTTATTATTLYTAATALHSTTAEACLLYEHFNCGNGECMPIEWMCDGVVDCSDGTDENEGCVPIPGCKSYQYRCHGTMECIGFNWKCDGEIDCPRGDDEYSCGNSEATTEPSQAVKSTRIGHITISSHLTTIPNSCGRLFDCGDGQCVSPGYQCDGGIDCDNGADERECESCAGNYRCVGMGNCISINWVCDGESDCIFEDDERYCTVTTIAAPTKAPSIPLTTVFTTATTSTTVSTTPTEEDCQERFECGDGQCVSLDWRCDGNAHCDNFADEVGCADSGVCPDGRYHCKESRKCIDRRWLCDGNVDCHVDREDESNCTITPYEPKPPKCSSLEYQCEVTGICIEIAWVCDGDRDCLNSDDERNCTEANKATGCLEGEVACDAQSCIPGIWRCDGVVDCASGTDEEGCTAICDGQGDYVCQDTHRECSLKGWRCDETVDCPNGDDESRC